MIPENQKFLIDSHDLTINRTEIYRTMGYHDLPEKQIIDDVEELLIQSHDFMKIQAGYTFIPNEKLEIKDHCFFINSEKFDCGKIIYSQIKNSDELIIFLATLGKDFDNFSKSFFESGDPYKGYLTDSIGSVMVETAIDWMCDKIGDDLLKQNINCTNRFSPGYCNWNIIEQQKLFAQLPKNFLDVELMPSSLMKPIKSVSGIVGIGKKVKKMPYTCNICTQENCIMRREKNILKEKT